MRGTERLHRYSGDEHRVGAVDRAETLAGKEVPLLNRQLRRSINGARDYQRPIDRFLERITQ